MRVAAALFVAAAAFAWLAAHGLLHLPSTRAAPAAIVVPAARQLGSNAFTRGPDSHVAVSRRVELATVRSFERRRVESVGP